MQKFKKINNFIFNIDTIDLLVIEIVSVIAIMIQLILHEIPCPLCILQRIGILAIGFLYILNLKFKPSIVNYVLIILTAISTASISLRQILLHIVPGTGSFGSDFLGYHLYTWVFIFSLLTILWNLIKLLIFHIFAGNQNISKPVWIRRVINFLIVFYVIIVISNMISLLFECGLNYSCPSEPDKYLLLENYQKNYHL